MFETGLLSCGGAEGTDHQVSPCWLVAKKCRRLIAWCCGPASSIKRPALSPNHALIEELHASGRVDRESVASRLSCLVRAGGSPILEIEQMAQSIRLADFAYQVRTPPSFGAIEGGKAD